MSENETPASLDLDFQSERLKALQKLDVFTDLDPSKTADVEEFIYNRGALLTIDGGGFHILWTMQLLKRLEAVAGLPLYQLFDLTAGSSAGALTSALIAKQWSAERIEKEFWLGLGPTLYPYRNPFEGALLDTLFALGLDYLTELWRTTFWYYDPPLYTKREIREVQLDIFGDQTMSEICLASGMDLVLMSKDVESGYTLPIGCFHEPGNPGVVESRLNFGDLLVRGAMEAAGSPPFLTQPLGCYIDAGYGAYNNPTTLILEEFSELCRLPGEHPLQSLGSKLIQKYAGGLREPVLKGGAGQDGSIQKTAVFSFGTAFIPHELIPTWLAQNPLFPGALWSNWFGRDVYVDASLIQAQFLGDRVLLPSLDSRRFNISFNAQVLHNPLQLKNFPVNFPKIRGINATVTDEVSVSDMNYMQWPMEPEYMPFYAALGTSTLEWMESNIDPANPFKEGLGEKLMYFNPNLELEPNGAATAAYQKKLSETLGSAAWLDSQPTGQSCDIFRTSLPNFQPPYYQGSNLEELGIDLNW